MSLPWRAAGLGRGDPGSAPAAPVLSRVFPLCSAWRFLDVPSELPPSGSTGPATLSRRPGVRCHRSPSTWGQGCRKVCGQGPAPPPPPPHPSLGLAESEDTVESPHLPGRAFAPSWARRVCSVDRLGADLSPAGSAPTLYPLSPRLGSEILFPAELRSLGEELGPWGGGGGAPRPALSRLHRPQQIFLTCSVTGSQMLTYLAMPSFSFSTLCLPGVN